MALETFKFPVEVGVSETFAPKINKVQFGDGYVQRSPKGINNNLREFNVTFKGVWGTTVKDGKVVPVKKSEYDEMEKVEKFLERHAGYKAFLWASERKYNISQPIKVVCENWSIDRQQGYGTITMTFTETL